MLRNIDMTQQALNGVSRSSFDQDYILQAAVVRFLEVIGEAANRVPTSVRDLAPGIPWRPMIAMRNAIVHGYAEVDLDIVWTTAQQRLPHLKAALLDLLGRMPPDD